MVNSALAVCMIHLANEGHQRQYFATTTTPSELEVAPPHKRLTLFTLITLLSILTPLQRSGIYAFLYC